MSANTNLAATTTAGSTTLGSITTTSQNTANVQQQAQISSQNTRRFSLAATATNLINAQHQHHHQQQQSTQIPTSLPSSTPLQMHTMRAPQVAGTGVSFGVGGILNAPQTTTSSVPATGNEQSALDMAQSAAARVTGSAAAAIAAAKFKMLRSNTLAAAFGRQPATGSEEITSTSASGTLTRQ